MRPEWIVIHSKARSDIRSGANIGLRFFAERLAANAPVRFVPFWGASWTGANVATRLAAKIASVFSSIGAGVSIYQHCGPGKIAYQNAFSGYFAALRTIAFALITLRAGCACSLLHVRNGNLAASRSWALYRRFLSHHADRILFVAQFDGLAEAFRDAGFKAAVLRNMIEKPYRPGGENRSEIPVFCFLGTRFESKGILEFLTAARKVAEETPLNVRIAGPTVSPRVEARIAELLHGRDGFEDLGVIDRAGVEEVLGRAHYIVLPTRYAAESMPRVLVEAMSLACVPITTDHAGIREQAGEVSTICNADELEETIREAVASVRDGSWDSHSQAAAAYFQKHFSPERLDDFIAKIEARCQ